MSSKEQYTLSGRLLISDPNENELKFTKDFGSLEYLSKAESNKFVRVFGICGEDAGHRKGFMKGLLGEEFVADTSSSLPCVHFAFRKSSTNDDYLLFLDMDNELWANNNKLFYIFLFLCYRVYFSFLLPDDEHPNWLVKKFLECGKEVHAVYNTLPTMTFLHEDLEELEYHRIVSILEKQSKRAFVQSAMLPTLIKGRRSTIAGKEDDGETEEEDEDRNLTRVTKEFLQIYDKTSYYPLVHSPSELRKRIISRIRGDLFGSNFDSRQSYDEKKMKQPENVFTLDSFMNLLKDLVQLNNLGGMTNQNFVKIMKLKKTIGKSMTEVTQKITNFEKILEVRKLKENEKLEKKINALDVKEELDRLRDRLEKNESESEKITKEMKDGFDDRLGNFDERIENLEEEIEKIKSEDSDVDVSGEEVEESEKGGVKKISELIEKQKEDGIREEEMNKKMDEISGKQERLEEVFSKDLDVLKREMMNIKEVLDNKTIKEEEEEEEEEEEGRIKKKAEEEEEVEHATKEEVKNDLKELESKISNDQEVGLKKAITSVKSELQETMDNLEDKIKQSLTHQQERAHIQQSSLTEQFEKTLESTNKQHTLTMEHALGDSEVNMMKRLTIEMKDSRKKVNDELDDLKAELVEVQKVTQSSVSSTLTDFEGRIAEISENNKLRQLNLERHYKDEFQKVNDSFKLFERRMASFIQKQCRGYLKDSFVELRRGLERQIEQNLSIQREQQMNEWRNLKDLVLKEVGSQINKEFLKIEEQRKLSKEEFDIIINEMIRHEGSMEKFRKKILSTNKVFKSKLLGEVDYVLQEFKKRVIVGSLDKSVGVRVDSMETKVRKMKKFIDGLKRVGIVGVGTAPSFKYTKSKFYLQNLVEKNYQKMITSKHGIHTKLKNEGTKKVLVDEENQIVDDDDERRTPDVEDEEGEGGRGSGNEGGGEEETEESLLKLAKVMEMKDMMDKKKTDRTLSLHEERGGRERKVGEKQEDTKGEGIVQGDFNNSSLLDQIQTITNGT